MWRQLGWAIGLSTFVVCSSAFSQATRRVSVSSSGIQGNGFSYPGALSADKRWVVFESNATNLFPGDSNGGTDVFIHDLQTGATELVDVDSNGMPANATAGINVGLPSPVSADGRFVAFASGATNLVPGDNNGMVDVFLRDRQQGTTELVSVGPGGNQGDGNSTDASISADGRFVAFSSQARNFIPGGTDGTSLLYVRDRSQGTLECITVDPTGAVANGSSGHPMISPDGRYVAFNSSATNLVPGDVNGVKDVFLRDRETGTTELVSISTLGWQGNAMSFSPWLSADGRFIVFDSFASNLSNRSTYAPGNIFVRDRQTGTTEMISVNLQGEGANSSSQFGSISDDGRYVAFQSWATDLLPFMEDTNNQPDIFLRDRLAGTTRRVDLSTVGAQTNGPSYEVTLSGDGTTLVFDSNASNLVPNDTNVSTDVFVREWQEGSETTSFTSLCSPGLDGVISCPCSNPPAGPDRGCDNSAATGGASLSASGETALSGDSLVFTVTGARPEVLSVLVQGNALVSGGRVYGQGVRCLGGTLRRICWTVPADAVFSLPSLQGGDPPVSVRSAAGNGDQILPGESRWYLVFYRDALVLGGCPETSTFNSTQTGEIVWAP